MGPGSRHGDARMVRALGEYDIRGIKTTIDSADGCSKRPHFAREHSTPRASIAS